jgi:hypothetical protein
MLITGACDPAGWHERTFEIVSGSNQRTTRRRSASVDRRLFGFDTLAAVAAAAPAAPTPPSASAGLVIIAWSAIAARLARSAGRERWLDRAGFAG